jgi:hypothetical protein
VVACSPLLNRHSVGTKGDWVANEVLMLVDSVELSEPVTVENRVSEMPGLPEDLQAEVDGRKNCLIPQPALGH